MAAVLNASSIIGQYLYYMDKDIDKKSNVKFTIYNNIEK